MDDEDELLLDPSAIHALVPPPGPAAPHIQAALDAFDGDAYSKLPPMEVEPAPPPEVAPQVGPALFSVLAATAMAEQDPEPADAERSEFGVQAEATVTAYAAEGDNQEWFPIAEIIVTMNAEGLPEDQYGNSLEELLQPKPDDPVVEAEIDVGGGEEGVEP